MDNKTTKVTNKAKVSFTIANFGIQSLPNIPEQWSERIQLKAWNELTSCCRDALPGDTVDRQEEYQQHQRHSDPGSLALCVGICVSFFLGLIGGMGKDPLLSVLAIAIGGFFIVCGAVCWMCTLQSNAVYRSFITDTKNDLSTSLVTLNEKYQNIMSFKIASVSTNVRRQAKSNACIVIDVELFVQKIEYRPDPPHQRMVI